MSNAVEKYINTLMKASTPEKPAWNIEYIRAGRKPAWNYIDGCMLRALIRLGEVRGEKCYAEFCESFLDYYVGDDGELLGYDAATYNLDNICEGNALIDLYRATGKQKYLLGIQTLQRQLLRQPRTYEGSYWHKLIYPAQVWLDGLYMAQVFRVRRAALIAEAGELDDVLRQFKVVRTRMFDKKTGLYRHGYDAGKTVFWADKNGLSANVWLRSTGWFVAAFADCAAEWNASHEGRAWLSERLDEALTGLFSYRDATSGLFYQVVDRGDLEGNYIETSGSALAAYACLRGFNSGVLKGKWEQLGNDVLTALETQKLVRTPDGFSLKDICLVAGLGPDSDKRRDGSCDYYLSEPVVINEAKGAAPFLMAYAEREAAKRK